MKIKFTKELDVAQLTEELLPLGVNSISFDKESKEIEAISTDSTVSDDALKAVILSHKPLIRKTRAEKRQALKDATNIQELKDALLEMI